MPPKSVRLLGAALAQLRRTQLGRVLLYAVIGTVVSLIYMLLIVAFVHLLPNLHPTGDTILAFIVTQPLAYAAHARLSFGDRVFDQRQPWRFVLSNLTSLVFSVGGMYVITEWLHRSYLWGLVWNWVMIPLVNFGLLGAWVFRA